MSSVVETGAFRNPPGNVPARASRARGATVREGVLQLEKPLPLHYGGRLEQVRIAWRVTGNFDGPLVAALGGISAGRVVAAGTP